MRRLLNDLNCCQNDPTDVWCDNQRAITLVKNRDSTKCTKHIEIQFYYTCDQYIEGRINVKYVSANLQLADPLTKPMSSEKFEKFKSYYGLW